jgi:hypothetical protein
MLNDASDDAPPNDTPVAHMPQLLNMVLKRIASPGSQTHIAEAIGLMFEIGNMGFAERQYIVEHDVVVELLALYSPEFPAEAPESTCDNHVPDSTDAAPAVVIVNPKARRRCSASHSR